MGKLPNEDIIDGFSVMSFESFEDSIKVSSNTKEVLKLILHHQPQQCAPDSEYTFYVRWTEDKNTKLIWMPAAQLPHSELIKYFMNKINDLERKKNK